MIEFTGERVIPGQVDPDLWTEHVSRYAFAARWASGARVLDLGCGAGYGTAELAGRARSATGIDLAPEAIDHASSAYPRANISFVPASATAVPFRDGTFDLITAFEVIEHLHNWRELLSESRRLLHPNGVFLVSTPNKEYYNDSRGASGPNPFHTHEFEFDEFRGVLAEFFPHCTVLLQNHVEAFAFYQPSGSSPLEGRMDGVRGTPQEAHFFLAVCSLEPVQVDDDRVTQIGDASMPKHFRTLTHELRAVDLLHLQLFAFSREDQRSHLEKSELGGLARLPRHAHSKLNFDRTTQGPFPDSHQMIQQRRQREDSVLEDRREADDARTRPTHAVIHRMIVRRVSRRNIVQRPIVLRRA